ELRVGNDDQGRPWIQSPGGEPLAVSLAHTGGLGVAIVRPGGSGGPGGVGIDVERVGAAGPATESVALTPEERDLLEGLCRGRAEGDARTLWLTRFWTAKEAVGKAEGTGLGGRPRQFVVAETEGTVLTVIAPGGHTRLVETRLVSAGSEGDYVVAWTAPDAQGKEPIL